MLEFLTALDHRVFLYINRDLSCGFLDLFFKAITDSGNWTIPMALASIIYLIRGKRKAAILLGLAIVTVAITDPVCYRLIKPFVHRLRPCNPAYFVDGRHLFLPGAHFLLGFKTSLSFPSNHAANFFGQATFWSLFFPFLRIPFFTIAGLVALSRVYVGVHYPSDIVAGAFIGIGAGWLVWGCYQKGQAWYAQRRARMLAAKNKGVCEGDCLES